VVSEHPRFVMGSCVNFKSIGCCLAEIVDLGAALGLFVGTRVDLKTTFGLLEESNLVK